MTGRSWLPRAALRAAPSHSAGSRVPRPQAPRPALGEPPAKAPDAGADGERLAHRFEKVRVSAARDLVPAGGRKLPEDLRRRMELTLGTDLSRVRVHERRQVAEAGAAGLTRGDHVFLAPGLFRPRTGWGRELLAHELAHVAQQRAGRVRPAVAAGEVREDPKLEREADRAASWAERRSGTAPGFAAAGPAPAVAAGASAGHAAPALPGKKDLLSKILGGVYQFINPVNQQVMRTGRAKNLKIRQSQHARDERLKDFEFQSVYKTDSYPELRGLEQILHDKYKPPFNKIKPIGDKNPKKDLYMKSGEDFLKRLEDEKKN